MGEKKGQRIIEVRDGGSRNRVAKHNVARASMGGEQEKRIGDVTGLDLLLGHLPKSQSR